MDHPRSARRRAATLGSVVLAVAASGLLAGCGSTAETDYAPVANTEYNPVNGVALDSTYVKVRNLYLVAGGDATTAPSLRMTMVNTTTTADELVGATVGSPTAIAGRLVGGVGGSVPVPAGSSVGIGSGGGLEITFAGVNAKAGTWIPATLLFRSGKAVSSGLLVQDPTTLYTTGTEPSPPASVAVTTGSPAPQS